MKLIRSNLATHSDIMLLHKVVVKKCLEVIKFNWFSLKTSKAEILLLISCSVSVRALHFNSTDTSPVFWLLWIVAWPCQYVTYNSWQDLKFKQHLKLPWPARDQGDNNTKNLSFAASKYSLIFKNVLGLNPKWQKEKTMYLIFTGVVLLLSQFSVYHSHC